MLMEFSTHIDEIACLRQYSGMQIGTIVKALTAIISDDLYVADPGDFGTVVEEGDFPTVRFDRTGIATIVDPEVEVLVIVRITNTPLPLYSSDSGLFN